MALQAGSLVQLIPFLQATNRGCSSGRQKHWLSCAGCKVLNSAGGGSDAAEAQVAGSCNSIPCT